MKNKILVGFYLVVSLLLIISFYLIKSDYSYSGYWADKIVCWAWLITTVTIIIRFWQKNPIKIYLCMLIVLVFLSILPMALPFFSMVFTFSTIADYQQFQLNDTYRIENTRHQPLSLQRIYIYKNQGVLEQNIARPHMDDIAESVLEASVQEGIILIDSAEFIGANDKEMSIKYTINGKTAIVTHKFNSRDGY